MCIAHLIMKLCVVSIKGQGFIQGGGGGGGKGGKSHPFGKFPPPLQ